MQVFWKLYPVPYIEHNLIQHGGFRLILSEKTFKKSAALILCPSSNKYLNLNAFLGGKKCGLNIILKPSKNFIGVFFSLFLLEPVFIATNACNVLSPTLLKF